MLKKLIVAVGLVCASVAVSLPALAGPAPEKLNYELTWQGVKVGTSSLETVLSGQQMEIVSRVHSEPWSAPFYKVEDVETSKLYRAGTGYLLHSYQMKLHEGRNDWHRAVSIDRKNKKFYFVNLATYEKSWRGMGGSQLTWDPVSSLHYVRQMALTVGKPVSVDVLDEGKVNRITVNVLRRETVQTPAGTFRTIVISPEMEIESKGLFYAKGPLTIWLTDDQKKVPVMMEKRIENLFREGIPPYLQQFTPPSVRNNMAKMETIRATLVGGNW